MLRYKIDLIRTYTFPFSVTSAGSSLGLGYRSAGHAIFSCPAIASFVSSLQNIANMQGLSLSSLKKHPSLIPLYVCLGAGVAMSFFYTVRLATRNPDVTWRHVANPEPQKEWSDKQYKYAFLLVLSLVHVLQAMH
ncbi:Cytochrome c oxidase subunit NDUFA4 [Portunus trituberculatus]|uniref:Cytochrome c oxidase subunit NDUFA4 n=1 Tax=Portunus trituberculatus TaxID=210409 RepID=A0A5B7G2Q1_PORTR|nr:Cytochrome c oxidase subunit NDUFA4 [Portunus trituberculatus]